MPRTLTRMIRSASSTLNFVDHVGTEMPAFATARSKSPPRAAEPRATASRTASRSVTSAASATASVFSSLTSRSSSSCRRASNASDHPRRDSSRASAAPMPLEAPVMMARMGRSVSCPR